MSSKLQLVVRPLNQWCSRLDMMKVQATWICQCLCMNGGAENAGVENAGAYRRGGKCRSDKVLKAIRKKYSKARDEIWLSWLSCVVLAKRNSQASRPVNVATNVKHCYGA